jgi:hypothetical protein
MNEFLDKLTKKSSICECTVFILNQYESRRSSNRYKEAEEFNKSTTSESNIISSSSYTTHPQAVYTSRLLDYKNRLLNRSVAKTTKIEYTYL